MARAVEEHPVFLRLATPLVFAMQFWGIWQPSVWEDEVATIGGANRSFAQLWQLTQQVDLVHGTYYALVHLWAQLFGYSPFAIRSLSAFAISAAFVFAYLAAKRLGSKRFAQSAAVVFALLPAVTWAATEARSYSLAILVATALCYLLLVALESGRWWPYFLVALAGVYIFMYLVLVPLAHLVVLLAVQARRRQLVAFGTGLIALLAASLPLILGVMKQTHQVEWIPAQVPWLIPTDALVMPYYLYTFWSPIAALAVVVASLIWQRRQGAVAGIDVSQTRLRWALVLALLVLPPGALMALSLVTQPVYVPRYVMFGALAAAMLVATAVDRLPAGLAGRAALLALILAAVPGYLQFRAPDGKLTDWQQAAQIVASQDRPGDAILFSDNGARASISRTVFAYPQLFDGVTDLTRLDHSRTPRLLPRHSLQPRMVATLAGFDRVWLLNDTSMPAQQTEVGRLTRLLQSQGFRLASQRPLRFSSVLLFEKSR